MKVIIDQFAAKHVVENAIKQKNLTMEITQKHRAEEDIVVAAASILARNAFLLGLDKLSKTYGQTLPKGASQSARDALRLFSDSQGKSYLVHVVKLHFKTVREIE